MLIQDMLTGYIHEVPDQSYGSNFAGYGAEWREPPQQYGQVLYDGLGNPVGFLPVIAKLLAPLAAKAVGALAPLAAKAVSAAAPMIAKVMPMVSQALPAPTQALPAPAQALPPPWGPWQAQPSYVMGYYGEEIAPPATAPMTAQQSAPPTVAPAPPTVAPAMATPMPAAEPISPMPYGPIVVPCPSMRWRRRRSVGRVIRQPGGYHGGFNGHGWW